MKSEGLAGLTTVSVDWEEPAVIILDQTQLPNREAYLRLYTPEEIWEAIYHLKAIANVSPPFAATGNTPRLCAPTTATKT